MILVTHLLMQCYARPDLLFYRIVRRKLERRLLPGCRAEARRSKV